MTESEIERNTLKVVLIGAGRLATNLGNALKRAHCDVVCVVSRTFSSAEVLGRQLDCKFLTSVEEMPLCDEYIYIICVNDASVSSVIASLPVMNHALVVHTAGSLPMDLFSISNVRHYGVFYPMQTFSKEKFVEFSEIPCFIEAVDEESQMRLDALASVLSTKVYHLTTVQRRYLHLAAVFACNFSNHCYSIAHLIAEQHQIPFETLLPLIDETAQKVHHLSPIKAQSGPAVRRDKNVLEMQTNLLSDQPEWQEIYRLMSKQIIETALSEEKKEE